MNDERSRNLAYIMGICDSEHNSHGYRGLHHRTPPQVTTVGEPQEEKIAVKENIKR